MLNNEYWRLRFIINWFVVVVGIDDLKFILVMFG